jgi:hypothetical protein
MAINSRVKGKTGELELAAFLREHGFESRRGQQFKGGGDSPDVTGIPGWHVECKRVEKGNFYDWLKQAIDDCPADKFPVVMHRRSHKNWVAIIDLEAFLLLVKK